MPEANQSRWTDCFLCSLEDTFNKDRVNGRPVASLTDFNDVLRRSAVAASEQQAKASADVVKTVKNHHGKYLLAVPEGHVGAWSTNSSGEWESFEMIPLCDGKVVFKSYHDKYLAAMPDGSIRADNVERIGECEAFEVITSREGTSVIKSCFGKYWVAMPDGSLMADSENPSGDWEQFEITSWEKDIICNREQLFHYLDQLAAKDGCFSALTYIVNQWNMGGVVRLKHHGCILTDESGPTPRYLKFDFGRWGIGWSVLDEYPAQPKGTCHVQTFDQDVDPQVVKRYCAEMEPFGWTTNNCSTFTLGLLREVEAEVDTPICGFDWWPTWSHCVANPPVQLPKSRTPPGA